MSITKEYLDWLTKSVFINNAHLPADYPTELFAEWVRFGARLQEQGIVYRFNKT